MIELNSMLNSLELFYAERIKNGAKSMFIFLRRSLRIFFCTLSFGILIMKDRFDP